MQEKTSRHRKTEGKKEEKEGKKCDFFGNVKVYIKKKGNDEIIRKIPLELVRKKGRKV